jgi:hypothetical protein
MKAARSGTMPRAVALVRRTCTDQPTWRSSFQMRAWAPGAPAPRPPVVDAEPEPVPLVNGRAVPVILNGWPATAKTPFREKRNSTTNDKQLKIPKSNDRNPWKSGYVEGRSEGRCLSVRDNGVGLPPGLDGGRPTPGASCGAYLKQLGTGKSVAARKSLRSRLAANKK